MTDLANANDQSLSKNSSTSTPGMIDLASVSGIGKYKCEERKDGEVVDYIYSVPDGKAFLVIRPKTLEVRCDTKLGSVLREKYESVMESRYFGRGGVEIVPSGQLEDEEIADLIRLSYNLTVGKVSQE